jgi:hypothetical protein
VFIPSFLCINLSYLKHFLSQQPSFAFEPIQVIKKDSRETEKKLFTLSFFA